MAVSPILEIPQLAPTQIDKVPAINDDFVALEAAFNAQLLVSFASGPVALSFTQFSRFQVFICSGLTANLQKLTIPQLTPTGGLPAYRVFMVQNQSTAWSLLVGGTSGAVATLPPSSAAMLQSDGSNVTAYAAGAAGAAGGAITILTAFDATSIANADPGNGKLRLNNVTAQNAATAIYMDLLDYNGTDWTSVLDTLDASSSTVMGQIRLWNTINTAQWILFNLTHRFAPPGYREFAVTPIGASATAPFSNGAVLGFSFSRTGDGGQPVLSAVNTWTARQHTPPVTLTDAASIFIDFNLGNNFTVTLGGNRAMANPANCMAGDNGNIAVRQDAIGSRTLTFGSSWFPLGGLAGALTTAPNAYDIVSYYAISPTHVTFGIQNVA
jgi:hypothetical protein